MAVIGENFPQTREARKAKLLEIKSRQGISTAKVPGKGVKDVYRIPLEFLSYNPHNTRFLAQAKTLEKRYGCELNDENPEHIKEIEQFIWETKKDKNESTIASLIKDGQLQPGVVTVDGIILSGNRRFRLLNEISRNPNKYSSPGVNLSGLDYFEAVILDNELTKREIVEYESFYQYGTEDKVEYDPIQKYLAADYQKNLLHLTTQEIANNFMSITKGKVKEVDKWLQVFELMEEYLKYIDEEGIYTALESREEAFLRLHSQLNGFKKGRAGNTVWAYEDIDLDDLKRIFFIYIRLNVGTHDVRIFEKIFSNEPDWNEFRDEVFHVDNNNNIDSFEEYRQKNPDLVNEAVLSKERNNDYKDKVEGDLKRIYGNANAKIINRENIEFPLDILKAIQSKLDKLETDMASNSDSETYSSEEFLKAIKDIQSRVGHIKQQVD
jgi:hypothetical protein